MIKLRNTRGKQLFPSTSCLCPSGYWKSLNMACGVLAQSPQSVLTKPWDMFSNILRSICSLCSPLVALSTSLVLCCMLLPVEVFICGDWSDGSLVTDTDRYCRGPGITSQYLEGGLKLPTTVVPRGTHILFHHLQAVHTQSVHIYMPAKYSCTQKSK